MQRKLNWGIIATGSIAGAFADGLKSSRTGTLVAVASRDVAKAQAFAARYGNVRAYGCYEDLIRERDVHAVYVATPHPQHAQWTIACARAGKHVLCEKPLGINHPQAMAMVDAAREAGVLLAEAFMYRCHPATAKLVELIRDRAIGDVRMINATFSFHARFNADSRIFANDFAGGGILDVGCYTTSISRLIAGAALGTHFADPIEVQGAGYLGQTGVDEWAAAVLKFPGGIVAQVATGVSLDQENVVRVFGSEGKLTLTNPYLFSRGKTERGTIVIQRKDEEAREIVVDSAVNSYTLEADFFGDAVLTERPNLAAPAPCAQDSLGNMLTLDRWRQAIGLTYQQETPEHYSRNMICGAPLARRPEAPIRHGRIPGIDKPVSRVVMGVDNQATFPHSAVMFDHYFERGGNTFDTAHIYARGLQERLLGDWIKLRGVRDEVVVISKGGHTPWCEPRFITQQIHESLERMQLDYADIYLLHRDNPQVAVGELVDVLDEHCRAGRIKIFGVSNWSLERVIAAGEYANKTGRRPISVVSNQFSLAQMVQPPWHGCVSANTAEWRAWLTKTQTPLLPWSSQARGFFVPSISSPQKRSDPELVRCWYSQDNFRRQDRAIQLAGERGVDPISIALAWVLNQPFPVFTLIGPRTPAETRSSLAAMRVELSEQERKWLDLQE